MVAAEGEDETPGLFEMFVTPGGRVGGSVLLSPRHPVKENKEHSKKIRAIFVPFLPCPLPLLIHLGFLQRAAEITVNHLPFGIEVERAATAARLPWTKSRPLCSPERELNLRPYR